MTNWCSWKKEADYHIFANCVLARNWMNCGSSTHRVPNEHLQTVRDDIWWIQFKLSTKWKSFLDPCSQSLILLLLGWSFSFMANLYIKPDKLSSIIKITMNNLIFIGLPFCWTLFKTKNNVKDAFFVSRGRCCLWANKSTCRSGSLYDAISPFFLIELLWITL